MYKAPIINPETRQGKDAIRALRELIKQMNRAFKSLGTDSVKNIRVELKVPPTGSMTTTVKYQVVRKRVRRHD